METNNQTCNVVVVFKGGIPLSFANTLRSPGVLSTSASSTSGIARIKAPELGLTWNISVSDIIRPSLTMWSLLGRKEYVILEFGPCFSSLSVACNIKDDNAKARDRRRPNNWPGRYLQFWQENHGAGVGYYCFRSCARIMSEKIFSTQEI